MKISERQGTETDKEWLWEIYESLLKESISEQWGWEISYQEELFKTELSPNKFRVILITDDKVGAYLVNEENDHYYLKMLLIIEKYQNKGIGGKVMEQLKLQANIDRKSVKLSVIKSNPVLEFYTKLGFKVTGEFDGSIKLEYAS